METATSTDKATTVKEDSSSNSDDRMMIPTTKSTTAATNANPHYECNSSKRSAEDSELCDFMDASCIKRQQLSNNVDTYQLHSTNASVVQDRLDESCRRMFHERVEAPVLDLDTKLKDAMTRIGQSDRILQELKDYQQSQQHLLNDSENLSEDERDQVQEILTECSNEIQFLSESLAASHQALQSVQHDQQDINVEQMRQRIWTQYNSQRDEMVQTSMANTAADQLPTAQFNLSQHDAAVELEMHRHLQTTASAKVALHSCATHGMPELMDQIMNSVPVSQQHALVNDVDNTTSNNNKNWTPLMMAASGSCRDANKRLAMVQKLLHFGADTSLQDASGNTAMMLFQQAKKVESSQVSSSSSSEEEKVTLSCRRRGHVDNDAADAQVAVLLRIEQK